MLITKSQRGTGDSTNTYDGQNIHRKFLIVKYGRFVKSTQSILNSLTASINRLVTSSVVKMIEIIMHAYSHTHAHRESRPKNLEYVK